MTMGNKADKPVRPAHALTFIAHAQLRRAQRCCSEADIALIVEYGTPAADGILMRAKDRNAALDDLRFQLRTLTSENKRRRRNKKQTRRQEA
jgi:hypothetical protein